MVACYRNNTFVEYLWRSVKNWGSVSPYFDLGCKAFKAADIDFETGRAGAGYGATAGDRPGGLGTAALAFEGGLMVGAIVAVNSFGSASQSSMQEPYGTLNLPKAGLIGANTTIAAVATNVRLTKAECQRVAMMAHDGLARSIRPLHTPFDGDTVFALSVGNNSLPEPDVMSLTLLGSFAADCLQRAVQKAVP